MNAKQWYWTALTIVLGALIGRILGGIVFQILGEAGPLIFVVILPLLIAELALQRVMAGMLGLWRRWRGVQPAQSSHPIRDPDAPWLVRHGLTLGLLLGLAYSGARFYFA